MEPRPYQQAALDAVHAHLGEHSEGGVVVIPTGGGKSPLMAWIVRRYHENCPEFRCVILAHVKELLRQNAEKLLAIWPEAPLGIYSAGLGAKQIAPVTIAGIQSAWKRAKDFGRVDLVLIDELHRVPFSGDGQYRTFLDGLRAENPDLRLVGLTATPFRLEGGPVVRPNGLCQRTIYEASIKDLILDGYLCPLTTRGRAALTPDLAGVSIRGGEFVADELEAAVTREDLVRRAVEDLVPRIEGRKRVIVFAVSIAHAEEIAGRLREHGVSAACVSSRTPPEERDQTVAAFKRGEVRAFVNVNIASEGFDAPDIDCVVMMRPTASPGLYAQQVGRGLRIAEGKTDCLILDYSGNVLRHGPIDRVIDRVKFSARTDGEPGRPPIKECPNCGSFVALGTATCPECGHEWPAREVEIERSPYAGDILSGRVSRYESTGLRWRRHQKEGSPDSLCLTWEEGDRDVARVWLCLDHAGFAAEKGRRLWRRIFGEAVPVPESVDAALALLDGDAGAYARALVHALEVDESGKYPEVKRVRIA